MIVHGTPGNPFLPILPGPGEDHAPWVQTDDRVRQLLNGIDADVVICGHTHSVFRRGVRRADGGETLVASPGTVSYGRGREKEAGRADYALLDWGQRTGWQVTLRAVRYDTRPMYEALVALDGNFPLAANMANRVRPASAGEIPEPRPDFIQWRWGDAPLWWDHRDEIAAWRALRGEEREENAFLKTQNHWSGAQILKSE